MSKHFFLNFGGPGGLWASDTESQTSDLDVACRENYGSPTRSEVYKVGGLTAKVYTYGIHRALRVDLPDDPDAQTRATYYKLRDQVIDIIRKDYKLLKFNCVTAVATVLNILDPRMTSKDMVLPWSLDKNLGDYRRYSVGYDKKTTPALFIEKYQELVHKESFSLFRRKNWADKKVQSTEDIILHVYGKNGNSGERTKSSLMELGWVKDENGILLPTEKAPVDFKEGLIKYNQDWVKVLALKSAYIKEAGFFSKNARDFFKDNPNYETALKRIADQAIKNPKGASSKVFSHVQSQTLQELKQVSRELRGQEEGLPGEIGHIAKPQ
jgi:hypothetical protein